MIDVVCDPGARYTKVVALRGRRLSLPGLVARIVPAHEADDLVALARRTAAALRPGLLEPVRLWELGDGAASKRRRTRPLALVPAVARATRHLADRLLVADCGGLRTRVFELDRGVAGRVVENERCTAGGGRFVETMSAALHVELDGLDALAAKATDPYRVSSPCPVFAESEVITQVNDGRAREDVLAGVIWHAVEKVAALVERAGPAGRPLLACGGLARLASFRERLAAALPDVQLLEPPCDPLLFNCVAGLAFLAEAPATAWPAPRLLTGSVRDAA